MTDDKGLSLRQPQKSQCVFIRTEDGRFRFVPWPHFFLLPTQYMWQIFFDAGDRAQYLGMVGNKDIAARMFRDAAATDVAQAADNLAAEIALSKLDYSFIHSAILETMCRIRALAKSNYGKR